MSALNFGWSRRLPVVLQTEVAECGIACLAMILSFHGHRMDLDTLRRRYAVSLKGATLNDLTRTAGAVGLATRALRLELSELSKLRTPCILHWSLNHFVVLSRVHAKSITIHDPARGKRRVSLEEASREFTGVALETVPTKAFARKKEPSLGFGYLLGSLGDLGGTAATVVLLSVCLEIVALLMPIGAQVIVDEVITSSDYDLLLVVAAGIALLLLVQLVVEVARGWTLAVVQTTISLHWSSSLFDQMMRLPLEYFAKRHVGDIISRFGSLAIVQKALTTDVILSLFDGVMSIGMLIMLFLYGGWLAGIALLSTGLNAVFHVSVYRAYRQGTEEAIIHDARQQTHFIETLRGIASVKLLGLTERRRATWVNHFVDSLNAKFRLVRLDLLFGRANDLLTGTDRLLMLVLGARMVMSGTMSLGMLVAFLAYRDQFATRVLNLIGTGFQLQMLSLQLTRLADIVMAEPEQEVGRSAKASAISSTKFLGEALRAENVSYRYGDNEPWVFRNTSLDISPGTCVAITGPSGCGKTTFLKILMGLIRPTEGVICCSGTNINALGSAAYRERIAGVLQDDGLFAGSLAENICGFDTHPDPEWMTECADRAAILDDIQQMPMGFETLVGDMGSTLSGGQKQRVILARALYRRPAILFLDEATSHLDEETEAVVAEALRGLRITRVIVAHRPATIAHADRLINLESLEQSRLSPVGLTAGEAAQPSRVPGDIRTAREPTQPLSLGPLRKSKETLGNQAEKVVADADTPQAVNIQEQKQGLPDEATERGSPAWKLKISALASRGSGEAIQASLDRSRETRRDEAETAAVDAETPLPRNIQAQEEGRTEEATGSTSSAWKPKISALAPKGGEAIRLSLRAPKETPNNQKETPNNQTDGAVVEATQRRFLTGKLKTSALVLAGAAIVGAVPTQLHAPRDENVAASSDAVAPLMRRDAGAVDLDVVNSERPADVSAKPSLDIAPAPASAPAVVGITQPALEVFSATPIAARVSTSAVTAPAAASPLQVHEREPVAAADLIEAPYANGGSNPPSRPGLGATSDAAGIAKASLDSASAPPAAVDATQAAVGPSTVNTPVAAVPAAARPSQFPDPEPVATVSAPSDETPTATQVPSAEIRPEASPAGGAPIPPDRAAETATSDATGTTKASLDGIPAGAPAADGVTQPALGVSSAATVSSLVAAAPPSPQFPDPNPVSTVSPPPNETPIATKVPSAGDWAEAPTAGGPPPVPLAGPSPTATSDVAETAKASREGATASAPAAGGVTQPDLGVSNAPPRDETPIVTQVPSAADSTKSPFANGAPIPPARPAETATSDSPGNVKDAIRGRGLLPKHRHEVSSPDVIARTTTTAPGAMADRRSHPLPLRTRTKPETAARAGKGAQDTIEAPGAADAPDTSARRPGDPLQLGDPASPAPVGFLEAPAASAEPTQQPAVHSGTR
jgi:ATP-binding cassette, subfamily B, bacterial CvaB/MchF/RaxB